MLRSFNFSAEGHRSVLKSSQACARLLPENPEPRSVRTGMLTSQSRSSACQSAGLRG